MSSQRKGWEKAGFVAIGLMTGVLGSIIFSAHAERSAVANLPIEELRNFAGVFEAIKKGYVEPVEDKKLITEAISGMLSGLDPHSAYLDEDAYKELQSGTQGEFGGLGIEVGMEDGFVKVVSPIEDTPAFRAGLKSGDLIVKIDDVLVKGLSLNDAVKKMRGKPGTSIVLSVARKGESQTLTFKLKREIIKIQSVKSKMLEDGLAYVRITQFQENTVSALGEHLQKLAKSGKIKGLVLDLRNDPGGLLDGAIGVSTAFLEPGALVVSTDGRLPDSHRKFFAKPADYIRGNKQGDPLKDLPEFSRKVPMVVLINSGSASASEIVAGALQDYKRATVMGIASFGKGSVQTVVQLSEKTAIKLTTARYYTPSGRSIQAKGIEPDLEVDETPDGKGKRRSLRESDLVHHLNNDREPDSNAQKSTDSVQKTEDDAKEADKTKEKLEPFKFEFGGKDDFQLNQAISHLKGGPVITVDKTAKIEPGKLSNVPEVSNKTSGNKTQKAP